jgi:predicted DNA-binding protein
VEETHVMTKEPQDFTGVPPAEAAEHALSNDLAEMFDAAQVVRERRPAKMVTALRLDLDIQAELETLAAARGVGSSTLMRQIIEEWVAGHRHAAVPNQLGELVRHLDAARQAAASLSRHSAA